MGVAKTELLSAGQSQLLLFDYQTLMMLAVQSATRPQLIDGAVALANAARRFGIPVTLTTLAIGRLSAGPDPALPDALADVRPLSRTAIDVWEDRGVREALALNGRRQLVIAGLWIETAGCASALSAMRGANYEVFVVADACGATSGAAHGYALRRLQQAGATPITLRQTLAEWRRGGGAAGLIEQGCLTAATSA